MCINTTAKIVTPDMPDGESDVFEILARVLQGDTLAPFLFIIVLDYALRQALKEHEDLGFTITPRKSRRIGPVTLSDLDFADDIALLSDDIIFSKVCPDCSNSFIISLFLSSKKNNNNFQLRTKKTEIKKMHGCKVIFT